MYRLHRQYTGTIYFSSETHPSDDITEVGFFSEDVGIFLGNTLKVIDLKCLNKTDTDSTTNNIRKHGGLFFHNSARKQCV